jgi:hypothetical protein
MKILKKVAKATFSVAEIIENKGAFMKILKKVAKATFSVAEIVEKKYRYPNR